MFSLLIKDRGFPVHIYLQHFMKNMNVSRSDAAKRLGQFAYQANLRSSDSTPLNNAMSDWLRKMKTPQWAIISSMQLLEKVGRVPKSSQEWAFWALSRIENPVAKDLNTPSGWPEETAKMWLSRAENYHYWYSNRSAIKHCARECESPLLAAKVLYSILGSGDEMTTYPDLFFSIDSSKLGSEQLASTLKNDVNLTMHLVEHVCSQDVESKTMDKSIRSQLATLKNMGLVELDEELNIKADRTALIKLIGRAVE